MTSWQNHAVCLYLRVTRKRRYATPAAGRRALANGLEAAPPPAALRDRLTVERVDGFDLVGVRPATGRSPDASPGAVVYLHGGAFINAIAKQHWALVAQLADRTGRDVFVPRYGLAPGHDVDDAHVFLAAVMDRAAAAGPVHIVGDSAGANLALLTTQSRTTGRAVGLTLIAPALDLSLSNPGIDAVEPHDPWLTRAGLRPALAAWAGGHALTDPLVSPLFGDLSGLPPTELFVGTRDICLPDCRELRRLAPEAWQLTLHESDGSPHVYPLLPTPEGRVAREAIVRHVNRTLAIS